MHFAYLVFLLSFCSLSKILSGSSFLRKLNYLRHKAFKCKCISKLYKTPYVENWAGKRITLCVQSVKAFGEIVDAVRIKPEIPKAKDATQLCTDCKYPISASDGKTASWIAAYTVKKYGMLLCAACAAKRNNDNS